jgi:flagellar hook-associated protein 1 FlgK
MGLINSALQVGRGAILTYQSALQIVGNNIANAGNADYTRQTAGLSAVNGTPLAEGMRPGAGVALTSLQRNIDESLENRIRAAMGAAQSADTQRRTIAQVETLYDPLTGVDVQNRLTGFFNQLSEVQNNPTDVATRDLAIAAGVSLADSLQTMRRSLTELGGSFNDEIEALVEQANSITDKIAQLNTDIVTSEANGSPASALRDQRDALLKDLSELVHISVRQQPNGSTNVYLGNELLVQGGVSRGLTLNSRVDGQFQRDDLAFADTNSQVLKPGGQIGGLITARESFAFSRISEIDRLASAVIFEVNKVHADGQGLVGLKEVTSDYAVDDPTAVLNSDDADLPFAPQNGSFYISVTDDATGVTRSYQIEVDLDGIGEDTTLQSLAADITASVDNVSASISVDNRLVISAENNTSFTFGHDNQTQREDSSNTLAALGINHFFTGSNAADIDVSESVKSQPLMFAASTVNLVGDGANAGRIAGVADVASDLLSGVSVLDFFNVVTTDVAVESAQARDRADATRSVLGSLETQRENISGVSLDEEAISLVKYERAFQGAARFVSVVDRLSAELIALVS